MRAFISSSDGVAVATKTRRGPSSRASSTANELFPSGPLRQSGRCDALPWVFLVSTHPRSFGRRRSHRRNHDSPIDCTEHLDLVRKTSRKRSDRNTSAGGPRSHSPVRNENTPVRERRKAQVVHDRDDGDPAPRFLTEHCKKIHWWQRSRSWPVRRAGALAAPAREPVPRDSLALPPRQRCNQSRRQVQDLHSLHRRAGPRARRSPSGCASGLRTADVRARPPRPPTSPEEALRIARGKQPLLAP